MPLRAGAEGEVWCESLNGEKTVVGTASAMVD